MKNNKQHDFAAMMLYAIINFEGENAYQIKIEKNNYFYVNILKFLLEYVQKKR